MSNSEPGAPRKKSGKFLGVSWGTWVALAILIPVSVMTFNLYRTWSGLRAKVSTQVATHNELLKRNAELGKVFANLQVKPFQICNKTADTVTVNWLAAVYHDGRVVKSFDSARCRDWRAPVLVPGDARFTTLNSDQENCNWGGEVVYYAMQYTRESEEAVNTINFVGHFKGYDRDCHNIQ